MDFVEVLGPPTSLIGRIIQVVFLATLVGAIPLAFAGRVLLRTQRRDGRRSATWAGVSRIGVLLQACGVLSSLLIAALVLSEADYKDIGHELLGPLGAILGSVCVNLAAGALGLRAWIALAISDRRT